MYEAEAKNKGIEVDTFTFALDEVDRAILDGEDQGFARVHVKKGTDTIVGATIVAAHAGDMISEFTLAMKGGLGLLTITGTIHPYPTQAEVIKKLPTPGEKPPSPRASNDYSRDCLPGRDKIDWDNHGGLSLQEGTTIVVPYFHLMLHPALGR